MKTNKRKRINQNKKNVDKVPSTPSNTPILRPLQVEQNTGLLSTVISGVAFGTGSSIAHNSVSRFFKYLDDKNDDKCDKEIYYYDKCLSDKEYCNFEKDMLDKCKKKNNI